MRKKGNTICYICNGYSERIPSLFAYNIAIFIYDLPLVDINHCSFNILLLNLIIARLNISLYISLKKSDWVSFPSMFVYV